MDGYAEIQRDMGLVRSMQRLECEVAVPSGKMKRIFIGDFPVSGHEVYHAISSKKYIPIYLGKHG